MLDSEQQHSLFPSPCGRYCFCALHAHMRLTEALVKPLQDSADAAGKIATLKGAFAKHAGLHKLFEKDEVKVNAGGEKRYKPIAFKAWQAWRLIKQLPPDSAQGLPGELAIVRILREVWPDDTCTPEVLQFRVALAELWKLFDTAIRIIRCKSPHSTRLRGYECALREFGARWAILLPPNKCVSFYLHTVTFHAADFMAYLQERGLCIGMLENSGAERRHEYGRRAYVCSGRGGLSTRTWDAVPYRVEFLSLRAILIWQYGSDLVAHEEARRREQSSSAVVGAPVMARRLLSTIWQAAASEPAPSVPDSEAEETEVSAAVGAFQELSNLAQQQSESNGDLRHASDGIEDGIVEESEQECDEAGDGSMQCDDDTDSEYGSREPSDDEAFELESETNTMQAAFQLIARNDSDSESGSDASDP